MNNKGFTLIELLAVIVILAIIALIATPIILNIINDAREGAKKRTAELVVSTVETAYSSAYMLNNGNSPAIADVAAKFSMDGAKMCTSTLIAASNDTCNGKEVGDVVVSMEGVECDTDLTGNVLSVTCTVTNASPAFSKSTPSGLTLQAPAAP